MMDLPYDIWSQISSYLPVECVRSLYPVNRALFDIAMDVRYEEVMISADPDERPKGKDIRLLRDNPLLWKRPKSLRIQLCSFLARKKLQSALKRFCQSTIKSVRKYTDKSDLGPIAKTVQMAMDILPCLSGVVNLRIVTCDNCCMRFNRDLEFHGSEWSMSLMLRVWNNFKTQLHLVEIRCAIELATHLQWSTSFPLNSLQKFSFWTWSLGINYTATNEDPSHGEITSRIVVPFLRGHQSTLREVSLRAASFLLDPAPIVQCLQNMPPLDRIELGFVFLSMERTPFNGLPALIARHDSLKSLTLLFQTRPESHLQDASFFCQDWCFIKLPNLTHLTLMTPKMTFCPAFATYIRRFATSLVSLTIPHDIDFTYSELGEFCKTLVWFQSLRHLNLSVLAFSPSTLAKLAMTLPHLHSLVLNYKHICAYQDQDYFPNMLPHLVGFSLICHFSFFIRDIPKQFLAEMMRHEQLFSEWELISLSYQANIYTGAVCDNHPSLTLKTKEPLVDYLPGVQTFCHVGREEFLQGSDFGDSDYNLFQDL